MKKATDQNTKKACEQSLEYLTKQLAEYKSSKSTQIDYEVEQEEMRYQEKKNETDTWAKQHPESHQELIKKRLNEFLEATKEIDYNAALVERNGKKYFKNPSYEAKKNQWKMAFRAGKEVTETARTFVQQWLKEL